MSELARIAGPVGCIGFAALLVAPRRDLRVAGLGAWLAGLAGLSAYLAPSASTAKLAAAGVGGLVVATAGGWFLLRRPWLLAFATLACVPVRIPVKLGSQEANLLVPLYAVVGAVVVAVAWQLLRGENDTRELGPLAWPLAAFVAWSGMTLAWTSDLREGAILLAAFVLPFGLLAIGFARLPWRGRLFDWIWGGLIGSAFVYAAVGAYQWATRDVFWNPKVAIGNAYAPFFRVNSVFWDPSIYGRYLVVAILTALAGILLGGARGWRLMSLYAVVAITWLGLFLSYSQSSFTALFAGGVVAALVVWQRRALIGLVALSIFLGTASVAIPQVRHDLIDRSQSKLNETTSGRSGLVSQGLRIAAAHPVGGVGVGGFKRAYAKRTGLRGKEPKKAASHTTPVTVVAEEGVPGLALFAWLIAAVLLATLRGLGRGYTSRVSLAIGLTLLAILVHSCFYNAFFEDPMAWALFGLAAVAARVPRRPVPRDGA